MDKLKVERVHTSLTGDFLAIHSPGKDKAYTQSLPECQAVELREDDRVADIGAFIGEFAMRCAAFPVASVRAYEPTPLSFEVLSLNLEGFDNAKAIRAAVIGDSRPQVELYVSAGNGTRNRITPVRGRPRVRVPAISYAEAVAGATVVKIDTEGAEWTYPIIDNLSPSIRAMIFEFHPKMKAHANQVADIITALDLGGFELVYPNAPEDFWKRFRKHGKQWSAHMSWVRGADHG